MLSLRHLMHGNQASNSWRRGPQDRDHEHRQSAGSTHTHSLQLLQFQASVLPSQDAVITITDSCAEVGGGTKVAYDLALDRAFRKLRPKELARRVE